MLSAGRGGRETVRRGSDKGKKTNSKRSQKKKKSFVTTCPIEKNAGQSKKEQSLNIVLFAMAEGLLLYSNQEGF